MSGHILIVDDEMPIRRRLRVSAERSGFGAEEAVTAAAALGSLDRSKSWLVLLDFGPPGRDGLVLIGRIRETGVPLFVLTAGESSS